MHAHYIIWPLRGIVSKVHSSQDVITESSLLVSFRTLNNLLAAEAPGHSVSQLDFIHPKTSMPFSLCHPTHQPTSWLPKQLNMKIPVTLSLVSKCRQHFKSE